MWINKLFPEITLVVLISSAFILCVYLQESKKKKYSTFSSVKLKNLAL